MSWHLELLHRDGTVQSRVVIADVAESDGAAGAALRIGRALDNDLVLDDPHVAAHHARLEIGTDGGARLVDLGSRNGILSHRNKRLPVHEVRDEQPFRLGQTQIRLRSSEWALAPERPLSSRAMWPLALLGLALVLAHGAWEIWLKDVQERSPPYIYGLSSIAAGICLWSAMYALFGRLVSGLQRFFSHLAIACGGYLIGTALLNLLELLAFSSSWLWPVRINQPVVVLVAALTVRFHLRLADPRHWPTLRYAVVAVAAIAIAVPLGQHWLSRQRLTDVQTLTSIHHPALRIAAPVSAQAFSESVGSLKERVDRVRKSNKEGLLTNEGYYDVDP